MNFLYTHFLGFMTLLLLNSSLLSLLPWQLASVRGERLAQTMSTVYLSRLRHDALVRIRRLTLSLPCQLKKILQHILP